MYKDKYILIVVIFKVGEKRKKICKVKSLDFYCFIYLDIKYIDFIYVNDKLY